MLRFERMLIALAAVVAVVLQVLLAPHIAVGYGIPNFPVVLCIVVAIINPRYYSSVLPFLLGLAYDLVSGGPLGAMAFSLTAFSSGAAWFYQRSNNDTVFMAIINLAFGLLLIEVCYGVILMCFNSGISIIDAIILRIFPCFIYDLILSIVVYLVIVRFFRSEITSQPMINRLS